jgi:hypothetical protein
VKKILLVIFLASCKHDLTGDKVARIYPTDGYADVGTIKKSCPIILEVTEEKPIADMAGWVCIPPEQATDYRRKYESKCK